VLEKLRRRFAAVADEFLNEVDLVEVGVNATLTKEKSYGKINMVFKRINSM